MVTVLYAIETSDPDGAEKMLMSLADAARTRAYRPVMCLLQEGWLADESRRCGYPTHVIPLQRTIDVPWVRRACRMLAAERVDLIHSHEFAMNTYCTLLSAIAGRPCITTVHGKNYSSGRWHRRAAYRAVARRTRMIAVSEDIKEFLATDVGIPPSRITTITNGIDTQRYAAAPSLRAALRTELGLAADQPVIGCVGRLEPVKGHTHLIQAARAMREKYPRAVFVLAGQGSLREALEREVQTLGLGECVRFLGYRNDVSRLLAALDIFVLPSLSEGLPLALLEAMAAGVPVVASRVGGIPEVIRDGNNGLLATPGDPGSFAEKLCVLLDRPAFAHTLGATARALVTDRFGLSAMADAYDALYRQLLAPATRV